MISKPEQQILIALDAQNSNEGSLITLVNMAKRLNASLAGLFVEDNRLIEVASLPFTTEINRFSAEERNLHVDTLMRLNKKTSQEIQHLMQELSSEHRISWTYSVEAGELISKALSYEGFDIFFPSRKYPSIRSVPEIKKSQRYQQLTLLYDLSPQFERALEMVRILASNDVFSEVTIVCETELPRTVAEVLSKNNIHFQILNYSSPSLVHSLRLPSSTLVLLPKNKIRDLSLEEFSDLIAQMTCSLLLVG